MWWPARGGGGCASSSRWPTPGTVSLFAEPEGS
jgi:hypothetical protein